MMAQAIELGNRPHVVIATPGRIVDHLRSSNGEWDLSRIKFLVRSNVDVTDIFIDPGCLRFWTRQTAFSQRPFLLNYPTFLALFLRTGRQAYLPPH